MAESDQKNVSVTISSASIIKVILFGVLLVALYVLRSLVLVVLLAIVLASAVEPAVKWFAKRKISRLPAVLIVYLGAAAVVAGIVYFVFLPLLNETSGFLSSMPEYLNERGSISLLGKNTLNSQGFVQGLSNSLTLKEIVADINVRLSSLSEGFVSTVTFVFGGLVSFILVIVLSFYLAVQEDGVAMFLKIVTPIKYESYALSVWARSKVKIGRWLQGQLLLVVIIGVLVYLGLTILGVKHALVLGFIAMLFEIIPLFGPILAAIPGIIVGAVSGGISKGFMVTGLYVIIHQFENHLIYPLVVKKVVGINPLVVILALVAGWELAGFMGMLLSVPISTVLMEVLGDLERGRKSDRAAAIQ